MRTRLLNLLLLALLALAGARLWQFLRQPPPALPPLGAAAPPAAPARAGGDQPGPPAEARPESYDVIVARDVFSPARGVVPPAPPAAGKPVEKPQPPPKLALYGVVILDGEKTAYLHEGPQEGRPKKIREGEHFAGGVVKSIRPDGVTFLFAGSEIPVPLRTPKEGAAGAAAPMPDAGASVQRPATPAPIPRRPAAPAIQQGRPGIPARQVSPAIGAPRFNPPAEPVDQGAGGEEIFPDDSSAEGDVPDAADEGGDE